MASAWNPHEVRTVSTWGRSIPHPGGSRQGALDRPSLGRRLQFSVNCPMAHLEADWARLAKCDTLRSFSRIDAKGGRQGGELHLGQHDLRPSPATSSRAPATRGRGRRSRRRRLVLEAAGARGVGTRAVEVAAAVRGATQGAPGPVERQPLLMRLV